MEKRMNDFQIIESLKTLGYKIVGINTNSKEMFFKHKDVDAVSLLYPEKDITLIIIPTFEGDTYYYGDKYSFMGNLDELVGCFRSPCYSHLFVELEFQPNLLVFEEDYKKVLEALSNISN